MKRLVIGLAGLAAVTLVAYLASHRPDGQHVRGSSSRRPVSIVAMSGIRLASIFEGLPAHRGRRPVRFSKASTQSCRPKPGLLARAARWIGLERAVHAMDDNPCEAYAGICVGCPTVNNPSGIELDYGNCNGPCTGLAGYSIPVYCDSCAKKSEVRKKWIAV